MRIMVFMDKLYKASGNRCRFTVFNKDNLGSSTNLAWSFTKNWRYTQAVNDRLVFYMKNRLMLIEVSATFKYRRLKWLAESGLVGHWIKNIQPKLDQCQLEHYKKTLAEKRVLSINDLAGPFLFLLAGMAISFLVFLVEKIIFIHRKYSGDNNGR